MLAGLSVAGLSADNIVHERSILDFFMVVLAGGFMRGFFQRIILVAAVVTGLLAPGRGTAVEPKPLTGTAPLTLEGDLASLLVDGVDRFLLREIEEQGARRESFWKRDLGTPDKYNASIG